MVYLNFAIRYYEGGLVKVSFNWLEFPILISKFYFLNFDQRIKVWLVFYTYDILQVQSSCLVEFIAMNSLESEKTNPVEQLCFLLFVCFRKGIRLSFD